MTLFTNGSTPCRLCNNRQVQGAKRSFAPLSKGWVCYSKTIWQNGPWKTHLSSLLLRQRFRKHSSASQRTFAEVGSKFKRHLNISPSSICPVSGNWLTLGSHGTFFPKLWEIQLEHLNIWRSHLFNADWQQLETPLEEIAIMSPLSAI